MNTKPLENLKEEGGRVVSDVRERTATYLAGGLGIVVVLTTYLFRTAKDKK